jgi:hypothetical protein
LPNRPDISRIGIVQFFGIKVCFPCLEVAQRCHTDRIVQHRCCPNHFAGRDRPSPILDTTTISEAPVVRFMSSLSASTLNRRYRTASLYSGSSRDRPEVYLKKFADNGAKLLRARRRRMAGIQRFQDRIRLTLGRFHHK